ncbi:Protein of unknown function [Variovorax sp. YR216]|nr:Protein of unknown function [Variovorax sp. YR216]
MTSAASATLATESLDKSGTGKFKLVVVSLIVVAIAELIGSTQFKLGPGKVVLLPMLWALLIAAAWGIAARRVPSVGRVSTGLQAYAGGLLNAGLLLFMVKLGLTVGAALPQVRQAGWALVFQEFGHAFGTLALGLPLALLLGIKREAVGATFSVGREGNLVIIGEKYGMASPEGRGVLAEYITGTVLGALFIAVLARDRLRGAPHREPRGQRAHADGHPGESGAGRHRRGRHLAQWRWPEHRAARGSRRAQHDRTG